MKREEYLAKPTIREVQTMNKLNSLRLCILKPGYSPRQAVKVVKKCSLHFICTSLVW